MERWLFQGYLWGEVCRESRELGAFPFCTGLPVGLALQNLGNIAFLEASGMPQTCLKYELAHSEAASAHPSATRGWSPWEPGCCPGWQEPGAAGSWVRRRRVLRGCEG